MAKSRERPLRGILPSRNGGKGEVRAEVPAVADDAGRVAELMGPRKMTPEQGRRFRRTGGSDEERWDVLLSMLAVDEHRALELWSQRTGLKFVPEPKLLESASKFYEVVAPDVARQHHVAGLESDGAQMTVATAQPLQPAMFTLL